MNKLPEKLETERLIIRPCQDKDYQQYTKFMQEKRATQYLAFSPKQLTEKGIRDIFNSVIPSYQSEFPIFVLAICTKEKHRD